MTKSLRQLLDLSGRAAFATDGWRGLGLEIAEVLRRALREEEAAVGKV